MTLEHAREMWRKAVNEAAKARRKPVQPLFTIPEKKYCFQPQNIRAERKSKGLSLRQLGYRIGVHHITIAAWERGAWKPSIKHLIAICNVLQVAPEEFFSEQEA